MEMVSENGPSTDPIAAEIVERVAGEKGVEVADVPPLSNSVDTDALEALVSTRESDGAITVEFEFQDRHVHVDSNRDIHIA